MIVFGDLATEQNARTALLEIFARFRASTLAPAGLQRHGALVSAYIEASRIAQGCVDAEFAERGEDALTPLHGASIAALRALGRVLQASWRSGFSDVGELDEAALADFVRLIPSDFVQARVAEGFAFYALYPEACFDVPENDCNSVVIGVRSIGMALAPLLAEALNASLCFTLRPMGHPFARTCALDLDLRDAVQTRRDTRFLIVDEGPGLSGSSFMAAADALEASGVKRERIAFVASNSSGPGAVAHESTLKRWRLSRKHILDSSPSIAKALDACTIERDMSGGLWREGHAHAAAPANRPYERRKLLVRNSEGLWLAKFSGLGAIGEDKTRIARTLAEAGFAPEAGEAAHGFIMHRWLPHARAVDLVSRDALITRLADYIAFRARNLPALPSCGASIEQLFEMAQINLEEAKVPATQALLQFAPMLKNLSRAERPIASDNRMHAWEWIVGETGAILKCDSADHCAAHDLIGCRDPAWDVVGAIVEFSLDREEGEALIAQLETKGVEIVAPLLVFFHLAYCAFQLGSAAMAVEANAHWPDEAKRWRAQQERYAQALRGRPPSLWRSR